MRTTGRTFKDSRRASLCVPAACATQRSAVGRAALSDDDDKHITRLDIERDTAECAAAASGDDWELGRIQAAATAGAPQLERRFVHACRSGGRKDTGVCIGDCLRRG